MSVMRRRVSFWTAASVAMLALWASGAPSIIYPVYAHDWGLTPTVLTAVFAVYPAALVAVMVIFGGISDHIGRRATLMAGVAAMALGAVVFAVAPGVGWLFAGRILQGIGVGLAMAPASAAMVEFNTRGGTARASSVNTIATALGLALATGFAVGAVLISLGAQISEELIHTTNTLISGLILAITPATIAVTALAARRMPPRLGIGIGGASSAASVGLLALSAGTSSVAVFVATSIVAGVAYGLLFLGGLGLVNQKAPALHRAGTLSMVYLISYLAQGVTAVAVGVTATTVGLGAALDIAAPVLVALALVTSAVALLSGRRLRGVVPAVSGA